MAGVGRGLSGLGCGFVLKFREFLLEVLQTVVKHILSSPKIVNCCHPEVTDYYVTTLMYFVKNYFKYFYVWLSYRKDRVFGGWLLAFEENRGSF